MSTTRPRRRFTPEAEAAAMVEAAGGNIPRSPSSSGVHDSSLRNWVRAFRE